MHGTIKRLLVAGALAGLTFASGCADDGAAGTSCTVAENADGSATISCEDGTTATVASMPGSDGTDGTPGVDGSDGTDGSDGADGDDCTVTDNGDGTKTISCEDGTNVTVRDAMPPNTVVTRFEEIAAPVTDEEKRAVLASPTVALNGTDHTIGFETLHRSGDDPAGDGSSFGRMVDQSMNPILQQDGSEMISNAMDFSSILQVGDKLFGVTQFESRPGGMYLSELEQDETTGQLTSISTEPLDFSGVDGLWVPCAGSVTPWGTHLGSEEYPRDGRRWEALADSDSLSVINAADGGYTVPMFRYYGIDIYTDADADSEIDATVGDVRAVYNPYMHGYATEVSVAEDGSYEITKHYGLGRVALELAYVMPDQKTVYLTDDGTNVGLFMFVADEPGDLSSGRLYAMKWNQVSTINGGRADIEWIPLDTGSVESDMVDNAIHDDDVQFSDLFDAQDPASDGSCPSGFRSVMRTSLSGRVECLQLRSGMQDLASRLETTRMAAYLGATTELRKEEGITYDFENETLYLAMSAVERGMEDGHGNDAAGPNHIRLPENDCGVVYALPTGTDAAIGSRYVAQRFIGVVAGTPITGDADNSCSLDGIANPDNVTFMDGHGILIIGEDTGSGHQNDIIWAYDIHDGSLTRIQTTPYGSETTSPYWYPNINGFAYLKSVIQHPYGESDQDQLMSPDEARAYDGYVGPFPAIERF